MFIFVKTIAMKDKLQQILTEEGLSANRLARMLNVQAAGISHILSGRNKPSFDLLQKILRQFPQINPDWLLLDDKEMYREEYRRKPSVSDASVGSDLFSSFSDVPPTGIESNLDKISLSDNNASDKLNNSLQMPVACDADNAAKIERILILYSDGSFRDFTKR